MPENKNFSKLAAAGFLCISLSMDSQVIFGMFLHIPLFVCCTWVGYLLIFKAIKQSKAELSPGTRLALRIGLVLNILYQLALLYPGAAFVFGIVNLIIMGYNNGIIFLLLFRWCGKIQENFSTWIYYWQLAAFLGSLLWMAFYKSCLPLAFVCGLAGFICKVTVALMACQESRKENMADSSVEEE